MIHSWHNDKSFKHDDIYKIYIVNIIFIFNIDLIPCNGVELYDLRVCTVENREIEKIVEGR